MAQSEALIESTTRHQVYLERLKSGEVNQLASFLLDIDRRIRARLGGDELTEFSRARLERLLGSLDKDLSKIFDKYYDDLAGHLADIGEYEAGFEARNLNNIVTGAFESVVPSSNQITAAIFSDPLSVRGPDGGKLLESFVKDWSSAETKRVTGAIRQGFFEGQTNSQIKRAIRGTRANKYADGLLSITSRNADAIVRTSVQHAASTARFETWKESPMVKGYRWVSTLDGRTSRICQALDGQVYKLGNGPRPPVHVRCRSTTVADIDERFAFLREGATRASKDGPVDANQTYFGWLKQQAPEFQNDAIGPVRAKLLRDGGLSSERFSELSLNRNFEPMTLAQMRTAEPNAFKRAEI